MQLHQKRCVPCEGGTPPLKGRQLKACMKQVGTWALEGGEKISKEYEFKDDKKAADFLKSVASVSIKEGHHPVVTWVYNKVKIELWTHAIGGLSENDFILAAKFDKAYEKMR